MLNNRRDTVADLNHAEACTASRPRIGSTFHKPAPVRAKPGGRSLAVRELRQAAAALVSILAGV